jgi:hypothetical protein
LLGSEAKWPSVCEKTLGSGVYTLHQC